MICGLEAPALFFRIVQLAEGVADFKAANIELKALDPIRLIRLDLRERRNREREVVDDGWLDQVLFCKASKIVAIVFREVRSRQMSCCAVSQDVWNVQESIFAIPSWIVIILRTG